MTLTRRELLKAGGALTVSFVLPVTAASRTTPAVSGMASVGGRLRVDSTGTVHLLMGKVELGQGIGTALAQIVAEELDVPLARVTLVPVSTEFSPDESYTFSSISVQQSGPPTRRAAANARQYLIDLAAETLGSSAARLSVRDGHILRDGTPTGLDYGRLLIDRQVKLELSESVPLKHIDDYKIVGKSVQRIDIPGKIFGKQSFLQDLRVPGMVHARVVRPAAERAKLTRANVARAEKMAGVIKVVRDADFVAVVAKREGQARAAAAQLRRDLGWKFADDLPDSANIGPWLKDASSRAESVAKDPFAPSGAAATRTIRASYLKPYQAHASISPSAAIAIYLHGNLTVFSHAQGMYPLRVAIAAAVGLDVRKVRCIHREASGCYGHNGADDAACDAAAIAMQLPGKPVRLQWERADEFAWEPYGSAMQMEVSAAVDRSGQIKTWDYNIWSCTHSSRPRSVDAAGNLIYAQQKEEPLPLPPPRSIPQPAGGADRNGIPLYAIDSINVQKHILTKTPLRTSALRSLGAYGNVFAIESFMDELANTVKEDPLEFRLRHLDDLRAIAVLEKLAEVSGWMERKGDDNTGWGLGFAQFKNLSSYVGIVMRVSVDRGLDGDRGSIELISAMAVCDAGMIINPDGVRAQIEGGIVQSASWTLKEQVRFDRSSKLSVDWASYPILRFDEVPEIDVILMERDDRPSLGVGEAAQGPAAAAIANAVFDASGQRLRELPLKLVPAT